MKWVLMMAMIAAAPVAGAQNPAPPPADSGAGPMLRPGMGGRMDPRRAEALRAEIEERFGRMVQAELQLQEPQMQRLREAMRANQDRRRDLMRREQDVGRAIGQQLQPGVAANNDSLNRLLAAQMNVRTQRAQSDEQFLRDLSFLTPVQRARFLMMVGRFENRMREIQQQFRGPGAPRAPGTDGPGMRGPNPAGPGPAGRPQRRPGAPRPGGEELDAAPEAPGRR